MLLKPTQKKNQKFEGKSLAYGLENMVPDAEIEKTLLGAHQIYLWCRF